MTAPSDPIPAIPRRKAEHLRLFVEGDGPRARQATSLLECVRLVHQALPELEEAEIDLATTFAGHPLAAPFFVTGMTGGTALAGEVNRGLARVAERLGIGFGLGSQRALLEDPALLPTYQVRDVAPRVFLTGNLGAAQVARLTPAEVRALCDQVGANAFCVHLNPAQELLQPEGDRDFRGARQAIGTLARELDRPLIVKEVGCGLSREVAMILLRLGIRHLDVAGVGGTSWVGAEVRRRGGEEDPELLAFWDWGLPTAAALVELSDLPCQLIASGGIRTGLDAARALSLGAVAVGVAAPALEAFLAGGEAAAERRLQGMIDGLRRAMLLLGCRTPAELRRAPRVIVDPLADWARQRGVDPAG
ncbi:MAG: type 2 isopentenyl-diphosphate Delta-isomerase [Myxococcota bacterium]|jgi:isopentenyl-diphosphate delta-isomerase|nr:type 2 isopentenyl-diphosphate Delta-isomerase [Myxococcota bacterium]